MILTDDEHNVAYLESTNLDRLLLPFTKPVFSVNYSINTSTNVVMLVDFVIVFRR